VTDNQNSVWGYFFARKFATPWKPGPRRHPKMPSGPWRMAAIACLTIGALASWLVFRDGDTGRLVVRMIGGAVAVFVVGMYAVETVYERRLRRRAAEAAAPSPIGKRR
jgi:hypothetical protein